MKHGGHILSDVLIEVLKHVKPGVKEIEIDAIAERSIAITKGAPLILTE
jgi:methionine aminopeptidase